MMMSGSAPDERDAASAKASESPLLESAAVAQRRNLLRALLPACQPQEGSPANTFTGGELQELQAALSPNVPPSFKSEEGVAAALNQLDIRGPWLVPVKKDSLLASNFLSRGITNEAVSNFDAPHLFRQAVRAGAFTTPTNGVCPGYLQCNLVVLPAGQIAFDFLLFCQRNSKACPLLEVCEGASSYKPRQLASAADLRTDIPKYAIYRDGALQEEVTDCTSYWPENAVSFLIGCSFSYDGALLKAGIPLRSADAGKNVPMFNTNIPCEPSGCLQGNMVVSMKPIKCTMVAKEVEITSKFAHAHGGPVCVGCPTAIGIDCMATPDWGDAIEVRPDEVPVFHACGVTPQAVLIASKVPFAITHVAGHMFVTDRPSDMGLL